MTTEPSPAAGAAAGRDGATAEPWPAPGVAWFAVAILFVAYTFSFADRYILSLLVQPIKADLALSDTAISLLHGFAFAIFYTVMGIPIGRLADTRSRRVVIAVGIATWSLMTALCAFARNYAQLFLARVGVGVGEAALSPAALSMLSDLFPPHKRARAMSVYSAGAIVGGGLAFIVGGLVIQAIARIPEISVPLFGTLRSWQLCFLVVGLPGLLVAAAMFLVGEPMRRFAGSESADARESVPLTELIHHLRNNRGAYAPILLGFTLLALVFNAVLAWTPAFLMRTHALGIAEAGLYTGLLLLSAGAAGMVSGGWLADRLMAANHLDAPLRAGAIAGAGCLPFAILVPLAGDARSAILFSAPFWFFATAGFGVGVAALQQITPNRMRGVVSAIYLFCGNLIGIGLGPTAVALLTDYVFGAESMLRWSILVVGACGSLLGALVIAAGMKSYRASYALCAA